MAFALKWYHASSMVRNGKGVCSVFLGEPEGFSGTEIVRSGNDTPNGVSLRSGSVSAIRHAIKRLEATIKEMDELANHIEKFGLDSKQASD